MSSPKIVRLELGLIESQRPRIAHSNARLTFHGAVMKDWVVRIWTDDGLSGFGSTRVMREEAESLLGREIDSLISVETGASPEARSIEFALWDLLGQQRGLPVYALAAEYAGKPVPGDHRAPCYDTSLYIDDLHLDTDEEASALLAQEAMDGWDRGHRHFKIKVGRGAFHMPLEAGIRRDIAGILAVREAVGPEAKVMIDANNGYNFNITRRMLEDTADANLHWMEEAFHEDPVLYAALRKWMDDEGLDILIADGEGKADPRLLDWAQEGLVNVIQYDIRDIGFTRWLALSQQLDSWGVQSAPHNYGSSFGDFASTHLNSAIDHFAFVEWDHGDNEVWDSSGYRIEAGEVHVPNAPGWGLPLNEDRWPACVDQEGYRLSL